VRRSSLQLRLLAAAAVAVVAALGLAGIGLTILFQREAQRLVAVELSSTMHLLLAEVRIGPDGSPTVPKAPSDPRFDTVYGGLYWQIGDRSGVKLRSRSLWDESLPLATGEADHAREHVFVAPGPQGSRVLVDERWIEIAGPAGLVPIQLAVASDMATIGEASRSFERPLAWSLGILALGLVLAAWAFVRSGLSPFDRLRKDLAAVHDGRAMRLAGRYPDEVRPIVADLTALLQRQADLALKARARAADLAHGLKTPLAVLDALAADVHDAGSQALAAEIRTEVGAMRGHVERELARARGQMAPVLLQRPAAARPLLERLVGALD
jgi:signal transduction histidine kinase